MTPEGEKHWKRINYEPEAQKLPRNRWMTTKNKKFDADWNGLSTLRSKHVWTLGPNEYEPYIRKICEPSPAKIWSANSFAFLIGVKPQINYENSNPKEGHRQVPTSMQGQEMYES